MGGLTQIKEVTIVRLYGDYVSIFKISVGVRVYWPCDETSLDSVQDNGVDQSLHAGPRTFGYFVIDFITTKDVPLEPGAVFV